MKYLVQLTFLIRFLLIQGDLEWKVLEKVTDYGQNVTLFCNVSNCCPKLAGWDRYTPAQHTIFIDVKTGKPTKKYDGKVLTNGYTLVIQNLAKQDLNVSYSCVYGSSLGEQQYLLEEKVFDYISTTHKNGQMDNHTYSAGKIAGIILGVSVSMSVCLFVVCFWKRKKKRPKNISISSEGSNEDVPLIINLEYSQQVCSKLTFVKVRTAPIYPFLEESNDIQFKEGEDAILTCKLGPDIPRVIWLKNDQEIIQNEKCILSTEDKQHTLTLKNTTESDSGDYYAQVGKFSKKIQLTVTESEIGIKVEDTSLQTNAGTAAIEADNQIGIVMEEKDITVNRSTKEAEGGIEIGIPMEEKRLSSNKITQAASGGEEIGMITKQSEQAATQENIEIPLEEICISTNESPQTASRGEGIGIPPEEIGMITKRSEQAAVKGNLHFKESGENIAVLCTNTNCKTKLVSEINFCHKCGCKQEATVSNQAQATKVEPTDIKKMLQEKLQKDGLKKTQEYIERVLNSHRQNPVRLAVSGRSHVGKSTFINTMRGSKKGDKSYAKSGHGNTTMEVTKYPHPENDMIIFYDLPGFGTLSMTKEKFLKQVNISDFDYFFIMFDSVLSEDDVWFVDQIKPSMTPFCLVRTKLDLTLSKDEAVEDTVIQNIRQSHLQSLEDHPDLQKTPLFIISSDQPHIGEMTLLIDYTKNSLSDAKWDAIIDFIPMITESVIQVKYEELCKRIPWAAFEASVISALPIPLLDIGLNMVVMKRELQCFIECFQLNSAEAKAVLGVNYRWGISDLNQFILTGLKAVINSGTVLATIGTSVPSQIDVFVPVIGSVAAGTITFQYVKFFLKRNLDQMKRDADIVFKHTLTKVCEKATSKADGI